MTLLIYEIAYGDPGKGRDMKKESVDIEINDHHELELYRSMLKNKYNAPFVVMKHKEIKK